MAYDAFLYFDPGEAIKIEGETGDSKMKEKKAIQVYSFSWGLSNPTSGGHGSGMAAGKVSLSSLTIMKRVDTASAALQTMCATGAHTTKDAFLVIRKSGGTVKDSQLPYLVYTLDEVFVESYSISGSGGGDDYPTESVSFAIGKVTFEYKMQKSDGSLDAAKNFSWNQVTNATV